MSVTNTSNRGGPYTGNGSTTAFTVPFYFTDQTHLQVIRTQISTGVNTTLALTTDYTVSGTGVMAGGTATMVTAPTTDQQITVLRSVPLTQQTSYGVSDNFPALSHEAALDLAVMRDQQLQEKFGRALQLDVTDTGSTTLPNATLRANTYLAFDASGNPIVTAGAAGSVTVSSGMTPVVQAATIAAGRTALGVSSTAEVQAGGLTYLTGVAGTNTITASLTGYTAYAAGNVFTFVAANKNTGAVTLNINSIGAKAITKFGTTALVDGDIPAGALVTVAYDGTRFQLQGVATQGSMGGTGWLKLPNGYVRQWGNAVSTNVGDVSVTFPIAFPTAFAGAHAICVNGGGSTANFLSIGAVSTTAMGVGGWSTAAARVIVSFYWEAWGY